MHPTSETAVKRKRNIWPMFFGAFVLFALFAAAVQWMLSSGDRSLFDEEAIRAKERQEILAKVKADNAALTTGYAWVDRAKGVVRIPVDRAVELAVARLAAQGEPRPANDIDPATAMGSAVKPGGLSAPQPAIPPFATPAPTPAPVVEEVPAAEAAPEGTAVEEPPQEAPAP